MQPPRVAPAGDEWINTSYGAEMKLQVDDLQAQLDPYFLGQASRGQRWGAAEGRGSCSGACGGALPPMPARPSLSTLCHVPYPYPSFCSPATSTTCLRTSPPPPSESYYGSNMGWLSHAQVKAANDPQAWLSTNPLR